MRRSERACVQRMPLVVSDTVALTLREYDRAAHSSISVRIRKLAKLCRKVVLSAGCGSAIKEKIHEVQCR